MRRLKDFSRKFEDQRGFLKVLYEDSNFVLKKSFTKANTFRGMHYQKPPYEQKKIIRVVTGAIIDFWMSVDQESTKLQVLHKVITPVDGWCFISEKFAHGFLTLEDTSFEYLCLGGYSEENETVYNISERIREFFDQDAVFSKKDTSGNPIDVNFSEIVQS